MLPIKSNAPGDSSGLGHTASLRIISHQLIQEIRLELGGRRTTHTPPPPTYCTCGHTRSILGRTSDLFPSPGKKNVPLDQNERCYNKNNQYCTLQGRCGGGGCLLPLLPLCLSSLLLLSLLLHFLLLQVGYYE